VHISSPREFHQSLAGAVAANRIDQGAARVTNNLSHIAAFLDEAVIVVRKGIFADRFSERIPL
jgi:hypothetical protein